MFVCCYILNGPAHSIDMVDILVIALHRYNVFQIAFVVLAGLTFVYYAAFVSSFHHELLALLLLIWLWLSILLITQIWILLFTFLKKIARDGEEKSEVAGSNFPHKHVLYQKCMYLPGGFGIHLYHLFWSLFHIWMSMAQLC